MLEVVVGVVVDQNHVVVVVVVDAVIVFDPARAR